nr:MAG: hypothetical protein AM325_00110 [Candidatus Thorarchaeota archaeon SMTZ1-45]
MFTVGPLGNGLTALERTFLSIIEYVTVDVLLKKAVRIGLANNANSRNTYNRLFKITTNLPYHLAVIKNL